MNLHGYVVQHGGNLYAVIRALPLVKTMSSPAPNWVLRTAIGPASMAGQLAVRSTGAQQ